MTRPLVRRSPAHGATVVGTGRVTPRMQRVTLRAQSLVGAVIRPAQDVELLLREDSGRRVKRRYTIRNARPDAGEFDLDVLLHGDGPGSQWGAATQPGDVVEFQGPRGKLELRPALWHLLIGDESALPAIAEIVAALPPGELGIAVVEVHDGADEQALVAPVEWVHRGEAAAGGADLLTAALDRRQLPDGDGRAYLMGETRAMVALRAILEDRGMAHDAIFVKGYWNIGRADRLAGRSPS